MKKVSYLVMAAIIFSAALTSCSDKEDNPSNIEVENKEALNQTVYADQTQGESTVTFTTTGAWTSSVNVSWLSISPNSGEEAGTYTVSIAVETNTTGTDRSTTIIIVCDGDETPINVTQKATKEDGTVYQVSPPEWILGEWADYPIYFKFTSSEILLGTSAETLRPAVLVGEIIKTEDIYEIVGGGVRSFHKFTKGDGPYIYYQNRLENNSYGPSFQLNKIVK